MKVGHNSEHGTQWLDAINLHNVTSQNQLACLCKLVLLTGPLLGHFSAQAGMLTAAVTRAFRHDGSSLWLGAVGWAQDVADELGIPRFTYFTSPTTFALLVHHAPALIANEYNPAIKHKRDEVVDLPGMELFRVADICSAVFDIPETYKLQSKYLPKAAGILINSWESYEGPEVATLRKCLEKVVGNAKVRCTHWSIGASCRNLIWLLH